MANFTAADVMRLREQTDAPMMECKAALTEADGDFEKAKDILKQKGKAAVGKKADRATGAGVVAISASEDGKKVGVAVLECETDFVSRNEDFVKLAHQISDAFLANAPGDDPLAVSSPEGTVKDLVELAVAKFRENSKLSTGRQISTENTLVSYVHHDNAKGAIVEVKGENVNLEAARKVALQVVASQPEVLRKEDLSQERLAKELEIQIQRAIEEGKPENIAENVARGRVNKEFVKDAVLLEQNFYADQSKTVGQYLKENGNLEVVSFTYVRVGA